MSRTLMLDQVHALSKAALIGAGTLEESASIVADSIVDAEAEGIRAVGLAYLPYYCRHVQVGKVAGEAVPKVKQTGKAALMADARNGFCHPAYVEGEKKFYTLARNCGVAGFGIQHSYAAGVIGWFVDRIAKAGLIGFCFTNASASMAPYGGSKALFGTNPIAFGVPRVGKPPLVIDQSSTATARVYLVKKMDAGEPIPEGWGLDAQGKPCTDPKTVLEEGSMAPSGGYKGGAMALLVEIMAAGLTGSNWSFEASDLGNDVGGPPDIGQFFMAIDPAAFGGEHFSSRVEILFDAMLDQDGVRLPGDRRHAHREKAAREGVSIPESLFQTLRDYARGEAA
ncbi:MAG: Ldh family oxidoreductase [Alphaproteobacteria bacterium]|nr:Ldh family oxidoreductase [Alphaproteobacteria bacterium]